jgi:serine/threonine-protein kinase RsbW/stage II sporulation protein AB (anti-sigma F factor)
MAHTTSTHDREFAGIDCVFAAEQRSVGHARRQVTTWLGTVITGQEQLVGDVILAVSEACTNVVVHAYRDSGGNGSGETFRLTAEYRDGSVHVTVRDDGEGLKPRPDSPGLGLGLPLIAALTETVEIGPGPAGTGTVVAMRFAYSVPEAPVPRRRGS